MKVLVGCETSGKVREAFRKRGHEAYSCDLLPADDDSPNHFQCDVRALLRLMPPFWFDLFIVHPTCTYLCSSGLHWNKRRPERAEMTEDALRFVQWCFEQYGTRVKRLVLENPRGCIGTRLGIKYAQTIQPHQFGDDASKQTDLWLFGVEPLVIDPAKQIAPRMVDGKPRWANQTDSGQNRLGPSDDRWKLRSATYDGIAEAFAENWG